MSGQYSYEPMIEIYIFETSQLVEQLEASILDIEKSGCYTPDAVNEIFRIMHTIKGSSAMMLFDNISALAHVMEDLFFFIREERPHSIDCSVLGDLILDGVDFIKVEVQKVKDGCHVDGDASALIENIKAYLLELKHNHSNHSEAKIIEQSSTEKQRYYVSQEKVPAPCYDKSFKAIITFDEGCEMENIRAYCVVHNLKEITEQFYYIPENIIDCDESVEMIKEQGFQVFLKTDKSYEEIHEFFMQTLFLKDLELEELENEDNFELSKPCAETAASEFLIKGQYSPSQSNKDVQDGSAQQSMISVSVDKLDKLMDLVGELSIAEAMVTQNPDLKGLELDNFQKAARQLRKITGELQNMVMSTRMVSLATTFHKMNRVIRDMCKKLNKEVTLELIGEDTEVDKNIIEQLSDPLMHIVRNAIDHGIEPVEERSAKGKPRAGIIRLEAKNAGSDVFIIVKDDGKGLNKDKIVERGKQNGLLQKNEDEMTDREIYSLTFLPGFSTKDAITEFSGRGVGMDVVIKNLENVGGTVSVDSVPDGGTTITMKIPLTLAIIDGMNMKVGSSRYTLPITSIKESFRPKESDLITDPDGNEMIMVRGNCYQILRLHDLYRVKTEITRLSEGILIMVEQDEKHLCIFADELIGQQQVVVKSLPAYIKKTKKIEGLAGCTLLGDGSISLILDVAGLFGGNRLAAN